MAADRAIHTLETAFSQRERKQACLAIRNLVARNPEYCDVILEAGAESLIRDAQGKMPHFGDLAKATLRDLGCAVELQELWTGTSAMIVWRYLWTAWMASRRQLY